MANITQILQALANLPPSNNTPPLTPPFAPPQAPISVGPAFGASPDLMASDIAPQAPAPPPDLDLLRAYLAQAGAAPTPPPAPGKLGRIAGLLGGISAGLQGRAPEFIQQIQQPQRDYQRRLDAYNERRTELGLRGLDAAQRKQEREQERITRDAQIKSERDFELKARRMGFTDDMARDQFRQALRIQEIREQERIADERLKEQQAQQNKIELGRLASKYRAQGAKGDIPIELAQKDLDPNFKLSPAAEKWHSARVALEEARAERALRPAGAAAAGDTVEIVDESGNVLDRLPYSKVRFSGGEIVGYGDNVKLRSPRQQLVAPEGVKGLSPQGFPLAPGQPGAPKFRPQAKGQSKGTFDYTDAQVRGVAKKLKRDPDQVKADLRARGFTVE